MIDNKTIDITDPDFGLFVNCAIRYAIGRETYVTKFVTDYVRPMLQFFDNRTLWCIEKDIKEAQNSGFERSLGNSEIDKPEWLRFLTEVQNEKIKRGIPCCD